VRARRRSHQADRDGITSFSSSHDIAAGSDGSMWFTEGNAGVNRIGRIATGETPPPPPPPPPPGPPPPPPNGPFVTVETAVATVDARGRATIVLACTRLVTRCDGQMLLTRSQPLPLAPILPSPPIEFAKTSFSIPAAVSTPVAVQLNVVAQSLLALAPGRSLTVDASVQVSNVVGGRQIVLTRAAH